METRTEARPTPPRAVDLRRGRAPEVEILASEVYDFLLSLRVVLASPEYDFTDFEVGKSWIDTARARCAQRDEHALSVLGHYFGDERPTSLNATLISLVWRCPEPRDVPHFLDWLRTLPAIEFVEVLLDQDGLGVDWPEVLAATLESPQSEETKFRLLSHYVDDLWPTVAAVVDDPEGTRAALLAALHVGREAVFAAESTRVLPKLRREAAAWERSRGELSPDAFLVEVMRGVQFQRPAGLRRMVFAPSYFCRPAVFYHFWKGTLTFCAPVDESRLEPAPAVSDPNIPSPELLRFFEALGDPTRLRILRLLTERDMYLTELAERLQLTKATTKHHMVRLRVAGLATLHDRDRLTFYALREDVARRARQLLDEFLGTR